MGHPTRIIFRWSGRHDAVVTVEGICDTTLVARLDRVLDELLHGGALHLVVGLHRMSGDDTPVLELLAAKTHRLWRARGTMTVGGLRRRLVTNPEVRALPEVFGDVDDAVLTTPGAEVPQPRTGTHDRTAVVDPLAVSS